MLENKVCNKCGEVKVLSGYYKEKRRLDGYRSVCKTCTASEAKKYQQKNKEAVASQRKEYRQNNKEEILAKKKAYYQYNKEAIGAKTKKYRQNNKEAIAAHKRDYYQENREELIAYQKEYKQNNKEKVIDYKREYYQENKEEIATHKREYYQENREELIAYQKDYRQTPVGKANKNASGAKYRALKYGTAVDNTEVDNCLIRCLYEFCRFKSKETGVSHHVDHIHPISKGGTHTLDNLQILTATENLKKGAR